MTIGWDVNHEKESPLGLFFIYIDKIGEFYVNLHYEYKEYEVV